MEQLTHWGRDGSVADNIKAMTGQWAQSRSVSNVYRAGYGLQA